MILFLLIPFLLFSQNFDTYFSLRKNHPTLFKNQGSSEENEIELLLDEDKILSVQNKMEERLKDKKLNPSFAKVGVIQEDQYLYWIRDAVRFPSGFEGTYDRILWKNSQNNIPGIAILIELPDGRIVCNINFRHATRSWELEIPRGLVNKGESLEDAAEREVLEETGYSIEKPILLGSMNPDSGILASTVVFYYVKTLNKKSAVQDETEAIYSNPSFSKMELKSLLDQGFFNHNISKKEKKIFVRDSFLTYAILMAEIKRLI